MAYPGNEAWRWRALKLWTRLLRGDAPEIDAKKTPEIDHKRRFRELSVDSLLQVQLTQSYVT